MPPDRSNSQPVPRVDIVARIRAELAGPFMWPTELRHVTSPLRDLGSVMDPGQLAAVAAATAFKNEIIFTLISKEYVETGLNWISAMRRLGMTNFFIVSGDQFTSDTLHERGVPFVRARIDESEFDPSFISHDGFSAKGLAMIAFKFPVIHFLLNHGYSVVFSDSDAIWLRDPMAYLRGPDIAFQRVAHHPPPISSLWSFAACTGFVYFSNGRNTRTFLDRCITEHQSFRCDQVAMNLAMLEGHPAWVCDGIDWAPRGDDVGYDRDERLAVFAKLVPFPIKGELSHGRLRILALPHDKFWRHFWVARSMPDMVVCHPNSPKDDTEKMKTFEAIGIRFPS